MKESQKSTKNQVVESLTGIMCIFSIFIKKSFIFEIYFDMVYNRLIKTFINKQN